jgi:N6-adenosine-specific RNA methylase IME4
MRTAGHIEKLAESIRATTLYHPILLRRDGAKLIVVAGKRRLDAHKYLRSAEIEAKILDTNEVQALLMEIDENSQRAELTALQRAQHTAERKKVWLSLHPETKHGGAPGKRGGKGGKAAHESKDPDSGSLPGNGQPACSFFEDTARTQRTPRTTVAKSAQIGQNICRKAQDLLGGTPVEDRVEDLLKIARLKSHDDQVAVAQLIHDGKASAFHRAWKLVEAERIAAEPQPLPEGPFRVIVADPPWHYDKRDHDATKRENTSSATMSLDDIKSLGVQGIAADDAILWLWTTNAHLPEAFAVAKAWGFTYKTLLTWTKHRIGMGDWLRGQTEHCLLCVRGRPTVTLTNQTTWIHETSRAHSAKPDAFYSLVESLCPGSKVELFSRKKRDGWATWGSEQLESTDGSGTA